MRATRGDYESFERTGRAHAAGQVALRGVAAGELDVARAVLEVEDFDAEVAEAEEAVERVGAPVAGDVCGAVGGRGGEVVERYGVGEAGGDYLDCWGVCGGGLACRNWGCRHGRHLLLERLLLGAKGAVLTTALAWWVTVLSSPKGAPLLLLFALRTAGDRLRRLHNQLRP